MSQDFLALAYIQMKQVKSESLVDSSLQEHYRGVDEGNWNQATQAEYQSHFPICTDTVVGQDEEGNDITECIPNVYDYFDAFIPYQAPQDEVLDDEGNVISPAIPEVQKHYYKDLVDEPDIICFVELGCSGYVPTYNQRKLFGDKVFVPQANYDVEVDSFKATDSEYFTYKDKLTVKVLDALEVAYDGEIYSGSTEAYTELCGGVVTLGSNSSKDKNWRTKNRKKVKFKKKDFDALLALVDEAREEILDG